MSNEIVYVCNSTNNKNVRENELNILEKYEKELYFEFGENETNIKKRFYNDVETLNKDFDALMKLKNKELAHNLVKESIEKDIIKPVEEVFEEVADEEFRSVPVFEQKKDETKKMQKKAKRKNSLF